MIARPGQPIWPLIVTASYSSSDADGDRRQPASLASECHSATAIEALVAAIIVRAAEMTAIGPLPALWRGSRAASRGLRPSLAKVGAAPADTSVQEAMPYEDR